MNDKILPIKFLFQPRLDNGRVLIFHDTDKANGYMSNWYMSPFKNDGGMEFCCVEQYLMYQKALFFRDKEAMYAIMTTNDPAEMKRLGREVKGYTREWETVREGVLAVGLLYKFTQNPKLAKKLVKTGKKILCEGTATDKVYANGLTRYDKNRFNPKKWPGQNILGYALMDLRDYLKTTMR